MTVNDLQSMTKIKILLPANINHVTGNSKELLEPGVAHGS